MIGKNLSRLLLGPTVKGDLVEPAGIPRQGARRVGVFEQAFFLRRRTRYGPRGGHFKERLNFKRAEMRYALGTADFERMRPGGKFPADQLPPRCGFRLPRTGRLAENIRQNEIVIHGKFHRTRFRRRTERRNTEEPRFRNRYVVFDEIPLRSAMMNHTGILIGVSPARAKIPPVEPVGAQYQTFRSPSRGSRNHPAKHHQRSKNA